MKSKSIIVALCLSLFFFTNAQAGGDAAAGQAKSSGCASCHGVDGKKGVPLAGKEEAYLAEQLRAYKTGSRKNAMMNMMAAKLGDDDINDLAAYYAAKPK